MIFTDIYFIIFVLTGLSYVVASWLMIKYPPKKVNNLYGYRTRRSKKSKESWDFAQSYSSKLMGNMGAVIGLIGIVLGFLRLPVNDTYILISVGLIISLSIIPIIKTEAALKNKFGTDKE